MSALGSKADIALGPRHVRFTPKSGHWRSEFRCPLCANSGHTTGLARSIVVLPLGNENQKQERGEYKQMNKTGKNIGAAGCKGQNA
jgi:hypothetical protein